jgi:hypothetical protein
MIRTRRGSGLLNPCLSLHIRALLEQLYRTRPARRRLEFILTIAQSVIGESIADTGAGNAQALHALAP